MVLVLLISAGGCQTRTAITIVVGGASPVFFAAREGDNSWETLTADQDGTYTIEVTDEFRVVAVCATVDRFGQELLSTAADGLRQALPYPCDSPAEPTVTVTGTMQQPGAVYFGNRASSPVGPWAFSFDIPPGTYDWAAVGVGSGGANDVRVVLRRDEVVTDGAVLSDVDLTAEGIGLNPVPVDVLGLDSTEQVSTTVSLSTRGSTAVLWTGLAPSSSVAEVIGQAELRFYDLQTIMVSVPTRTGERGGLIEVHTDTPPSQITLPPVPDVGFDATGISWVRTGDESYGDLTIETTCVQDPCSSSVERLVATGSWLDATGQSHLAFDEDAPGYPSPINPQAPRIGRFTAVAIEGDVEVYASKSLLPAARTFKPRFGVGRWQQNLGRTQMGYGTSR